MADDPELRRVLWYVLGGARGGENRARIIRELAARPCNLNQLAKSLDLDYRTVLHHIGILKRNALVVTQGERYGLTYFVSPRLEACFEVFEDVAARFGFK